MSPLRPLFLYLITLLLTQPLPTLSQTLPPGMTIGADGPASPAVKSYWMNHAGLNVANLTASRHFYGTILGMRHIFTIEYTPHFTMTYMGFPQGGHNGTGFQTGPELLRDKNNIGGLIKFYHFSEANKPLEPSTKRTSTFANLGLIVPDIEEAQRRFEEFGVTIVKPLGERDVPPGSPIAISMGLGPESTGNVTEIEALVEGLQTTFFDQVLFVEDPDGNLIEVLEQNGF